MASLRVLIVEDSENDALLILAELRRGGWDLYRTSASIPRRRWSRRWRRRRGMSSSRTTPCRSSAGRRRCQIAHQLAADLPFIVVSGTVGEETAVAAMKQGADDYLFKGNLRRLAPAMERELRMAAARRKAALTEQELQQAHSDLVASEGLAKANLASAG